MEEKPDSNRRIRTILLGLGRISHTLERDPYRGKPCTHSGVLFSPWGSDRFEVIAGYDSNPEKRSDWGATWKVKALDPSQLGLLPAELAIIATPSQTHIPLALHCLNVGIPHLLVEKPMGMSLGEARSLGRKKKGYIWVNHERRYHPRYQFVRNQFQSGGWGDIQSIRASVFTSAKNPGMAFSKAGGGPLLHDGTHAVDLLHWFLGKLRLQYANIKRPRRNAVEDRAIATFFGPAGELAFLDVAGGRSYFQFELDILSNSHRVILSNDGFQFFQVTPSTLYEGFQSLSPFLPVGFPKQEDSNAFMGLYEEIWKVLRGGSTYQEGSFENNLEILKTLDSIYSY